MIKQLAITDLVQDQVLRVLAAKGAPSSFARCVLAQKFLLEKWKRAPGLEAIAHQAGVSLSTAKNWQRYMRALGLLQVARVRDPEKRGGIFDRPAIRNLFLPSQALIKDIKTSLATGLERCLAMFPGRKAGKENREKAILEKKFGSNGTLFEQQRIERAFDPLDESLVRECFEQGFKEIEATVRGLKATSRGAKYCLLKEDSIFTLMKVWNEMVLKGGLEQKYSTWEDAKAWARMHFQRWTGLTP
jgi:hypothetical protein